MDVAAEWYKSPDLAVGASSPSQLLERVAAAGGVVGRSGMCLIEAVDVGVDDLPALVAWMRTLEDENRDDAQAELEHWLKWLLDSDDTDGLNGLSGTLKLIAIRVPISRLASDHDLATVTSRDLIVIAGSHSLVRLWLPASDPNDGNDPRWIDDQGNVDALAEDVEGPTWLVRCGHRTPVAALAWELRCAAHSQALIAEKLGERLAAWQTDAWTSFAHDDAHDRAPSAIALANLAQAGHALQAPLGRIQEVAHDLGGKTMDDYSTMLFSLAADDLEKLRATGDQALRIVAQGQRAVTELGRTIQDTMGVLATTSLHRLMEASEQQQRVSARFEQRVAILAGVLTGPAVVAGLAGANIDFWPLPQQDGVLAAGALPLVVFLCVVVGAAAWRYLRPNRQESDGGSSHR